MEHENVEKNSLDDDEKISLEDDEEYNKLLTELKAEGLEKANEIKENLSKQMREHFEKMQDDVQKVFDRKLSDLKTTNNGLDRLSDKVTATQNDILRINKVFRDISKPLGTTWKPLYYLLTAGIAEEKIQKEFLLLEKQSSFIQPYKALLSWKELKGSEFEIRDLLPAMKQLQLNDLHDKTQRILLCENKDELFDLSCIGSKQNTDLNPSIDPTRMSLQEAREKMSASSKMAALKLQKNQKKGVGDNKELNNHESSNKIIGNANSNDETNIINKNIWDSHKTSDNKNLLDNKHLLDLAKCIPNDWSKLGPSLGLTSREIADILESDGNIPTYQGAFYMLFNWREANINNVKGSEGLDKKSDDDEGSSQNIKELLELLKNGLKSMGRAELVEMFQLN